MPSAHATDLFSLPRPDRSVEIDAFLEAVGWGDAVRSHLAGDASFRRYERVTMAGRPAVLMDAPPPWEDVRPFVKVTQVLKSLGLNAPGIVAADEEQGFLLLEDLGDASFTRVLKAAPEQELTLYQAAISALAVLQGRCKDTDPHVPPYDDAVYMREVMLFADWFLPQVCGCEKALALKAEYTALWQGILRTAGLRQSVLVHRDYHADNLLWLPEREGIARVGMLDYQDALMGDPLYDVISLLEDARRDVKAEHVQACYAQFIRETGEEDVLGAERRYAILAAQRNLKIIGIFTRLCVRDGKPHYLDYLPRVWGHMMRDAQDARLRPHLAALHAFLDAHVPASARGIISVDPSRGSLA